MINVLLALSLWHKEFENKCIDIYCDNAAVVSILNTGKGLDELLLSIARNIWLVAATNDIDLSITHIPGKSNTVADLLSHWQIAGTNRDKLYLHVPKPQWQMVTDKHMFIDYNI